jgi:glutamate/tyrosine decarboxylase-like PLP-dependent enzyme
MHLFDFSKNERLALWNELTALLEDYYENTSDLRVAPGLDHQEILALAGKYDFEAPVSANDAINHVIEGIKKYGVQTAHPSYYGLFNPRVNFAGILADMITATLNPQIAAWSHAPFAAEAESYLIQEFGKKFGFPENSIDGVFCNGGAEANHTAVLCAINHAFPGYAEKGLAACSKKLVLYCSSESHHSIGKAAMMTGLGVDAVRSVPGDEQQRMRTDKLEELIEQDLMDGHEPFLVVATAGTTGSGAIDPIGQIAGICRKHKLWFHADAAYGGAAILDPETRHVLKGIEKADSITFDMHKWMSVPMGTSVFLTANTEILFKTFRITTEYMPREADQLNITDPYIHSMQWSRRFIGLRTYLSMIIFGWEGYARTVSHQVKMGNYMKEELHKNGWHTLNDTELPVACFADESFTTNPGHADRICEQVLKSGKAWISVYPIHGINTLRACITNYATTEKEIDHFIELINKLRADLL